MENTTSVLRIPLQKYQSSGQIWGHKYVEFAITQNIPIFNEWLQIMPRHLQNLLPLFAQDCVALQENDHSSMPLGKICKANRTHYNCTQQADKGRTIWEQQLVQLEPHSFFLPPVKFCILRILSVLELPLT